MNCKNVTAVVKEKTPSISVDKCDKVTLVLNENNVDTDIVSCKANELNVSVEKSTGEDSKLHLISDQLITKWNAGTKKFETKVYDKFLWWGRDDDVCSYWLWNLDLLNETC